MRGKQPAGDDERVRLMRRRTVLVLPAAVGLVAAASLPAAATSAATPRQFHKVAPSNGATGQPRTPTLKWGASRYATGYRYCVDRTKNNRCDTRWIATHERRSVRLSGLRRGATYYWQVKAINHHGSVAADKGVWFRFKVAKSAPSQAVPRAGRWTMTLPPTSGSGGPGSIEITGAQFTVASDHTAVNSFGFAYTYSGIPRTPGGSCSGAGWSSESARSPISHSHFSTPAVTGAWTGPGSATFDGTFASATTAHGTATFQVFISGSGCQFSGTVSTRSVSWTGSPG